MSTPPVAPAAAMAPPPAVPEAPRPAGADAVDAALSQVTRFNAEAALNQVAVERAQKRIHDATQQALTLAQRAAQADAGLNKRLAASRADVEAAHAGLAKDMAAFPSQAASQLALADAALKPCAASPELAAYAGCLDLAAEQAALSQTLEALGAQYQAAEVAYRQERPRLDEAAATVALSR